MANIKIAPLNIESIDYVFANLWQSGRDELKKFHYTVEEEKAFFLRMVGKPFAISIMDECGTPCAVGALDSVGPMKWDEHFAATDDGFKKVWLPLSIFFRKMSDQIARDGGEVRVVSHLSPVDSGNWHEAMNFKYCGHAGPCHFYEKGA